MESVHRDTQSRSSDISGRDDHYFRHLAEAIPHIVYIADVEGNVEYFNERWYRYTGYRCDNYRPEDWFAALHPEDRPRILAAWEAVRPAGKPFELEYRLRHADGTYRWHLGRSVPVADARGAIVNWFGTATDIHERKESEERTDRSERRFRALIERSHEVIALSDARGTAHYMSPSATAVLGYSPEELLTGDRADRVHPDDWEMVQRMFAAVAGTPEHTVTFSMRYRHKDGRWLWLESTLTNLLDEPSIGAIIANSHDITAQRQTEGNWRFLAEASKVLSSSLDYRTTLAAVANLGVPEIADWCRVDMLTDAGAVEMLAVAHVDPEKVQWAKELNEATPIDMDAPTGLPNVLRTGQSEFYPEIPEEMLVAAAKNEEELALIRRIGFSAAMVVPLLVQGSAIGAITFVAAESGRHYTTADLAMAEEVASRAALAIENARLYTAAQRAIGIRDEFISMASHELKTPVTTLKMYTQVLQRQFAQRDARVAGHLGKMDAQVNKLTTLINDLLNVTRLQRGELEFREELFDLNGLVADIVENLQTTTTRHTITVVGRMGRPLPGDRDRIGQVLTNLLANAIKYSPQADRVIVHLTDEEDAAVIRVQDFGIGIAREHQPHIFEQFYRVSDPSEKTYPGLGLGLFISNGIVARHGGTMRVESVKGEGAAFIVTLPYRSAAAGGADKAGA